MTYNFFHQRKTSIKEQLGQALGPLAVNYEIRQLVTGRPGRFGLGLEPERIKFIEDRQLTSLSSHTAPTFCSTLYATVQNLR